MPQTDKEKGEINMKKRIIFLMLVAILTATLCACATQEEDSAPHPLSANFQTEDELVEALVAFFSSDNWHYETVEEITEEANAVREVLTANTAIHHYFQESDEAIALAQRLWASIDDETFLVFDACNTTEWYIGIAENETEANTSSQVRPLFFGAWHYNRPTFDTVADGIRDNFKDPLSVSVLSGEWLFIEPVDGYFEGPLQYVGIVNVRATNSFGGYLTKEYVIEGSIRGDVKLVREYKDYERDFLGRNDDFYRSYNAQTYCGIYVPNTMEAENNACPLSWIYGS